MKKVILTINELIEVESNSYLSYARFKYNDECEIMFEKVQSHEIVAILKNTKRDTDRFILLNNFSDDTLKLVQEILEK